MNLYELFPTASVDDLSMYFSNSLVRATTPTNKSLAWYAIYGFQNADSPSWNIILYDFAVRRQKAIPVKDVQVFVDFPEEGFYNFRGTTVLTARLAHRQNCKGLCNRTFNIISLFETVLQIPPISGALTRKLYSPFTYYAEKGDRKMLDWFYQVFSRNERSSYEKALAEICKERVLARAITKNICVSRGVEDLRPSVWFKQHLVGNIPTPKEIVVKNTLFYQEIVDVFSPLGITVSGV